MQEKPASATLAFSMMSQYPVHGGVKCTPQFFFKMSPVQSPVILVLMAEQISLEYHRGWFIWPIGHHPSDKKIPPGELGGIPPYCSISKMSNTPTMFPVVGVFDILLLIQSWIILGFIRRFPWQQRVNGFRQPLGDGFGSRMGGGFDVRIGGWFCNNKPPAP